MIVKIVNLHRAYKINGRLVEKIAARILGYCKARRDSGLEIVFLTDSGIRPLNKRYKREDRPTDVLSFGLSERPLLGDIFISIDRARKNSKIFKSGLEEEVTRYVTHGILHLMGYDDRTGKARARMESKQEEILRKLCKRENLSKVLTPR